MLEKSLGPSKGKGSNTCKWMLQHFEEVIARYAAFPLTITKPNSKVEVEKQRLSLELHMRTLSPLRHLQEKYHPQIEMQMLNLMSMMKNHLNLTLN